MPEGKGGQAMRPTPPANKAQAFVSKHSLALALCLIAIAAVRIVSTYNVLGSTSDEPAQRTSIICKPFRVCRASGKSTRLNLPKGGPP
jgi:hypothetical protein